MFGTDQVIGLSRTLDEGGRSPFPSDRESCENADPCAGWWPKIIEGRIARLAFQAFNCAVTLTWAGTLRVWQQIGNTIGDVNPMRLRCELVQVESRTRTIQGLPTSTRCLRNATWKPELRNNLTTPAGLL